MQYALLPGIQMVLGGLFTDHAPSIWIWLKPLLSYTFGLFWVMPVFVLSRIVNCFWFQDIADQAFRLLGLKQVSMGEGIEGQFVQEIPAN